ncbi:MAG TPA: hypothetical protein VGC07_06770 [Granulicella sp.]
MSLENTAPKKFDQLAELHVAGLFAEAKWSVYFPHRDQGFDFIAVKKVADSFVIRPVQVKGKYPNADKKNKVSYGYVGELSQTDPEMVLAIPYFASGEIPILEHVAFMPLTRVREHQRGFRCEPAKFVNGKAFPRRDYAKFFDRQGLKHLEQQTWSKEILSVVESVDAAE